MGEHTIANTRRTIRHAAQDKQHRTSSTGQATHDKQHTTSNTGQATQDKQHTTSNTRQATHDKQHTTSNTRQATHDKQHTTSNTRQATWQATGQVASPLQRLGQGAVGQRASYCTMYIYRYFFFTRDLAELRYKIYIN